MSLLTSQPMGKKGEIGAPGWNRTSDPQLRRLLLATRWLTVLYIINDLCGTDET